MDRKKEWESDVFKDGEGGSESIICNCGKEGKEEEKEDRKQERGICEKGKK